MVGSVSGGCVEGAVVAEALDALADGRPRLLDYGVSDAEAFAVGLACGGRDPGDGRAGRASARGRRRTSSSGCRRRAPRASRWSMPCAPEDWQRRLVAGAGDPLWPAAEAALVADQSGFAGDWFLGVHNPPLRMAVVGAVHIAQALVPMARLAGYDVAVIDPREAFASAARFPDTTLSHDWPDDGAGRVRARHAHRGGDADPRPEARRSGDRGGAARAGLLSRLPRLDAHPCEAGGAAAGGRLRRRRRSPASMRRSAPTSARSRRPRSPSRSSPRSPSGCGGRRRGADDALRAGPAAEAEGAVLAHSLAVGGLRLKKGRRARRRRRGGAGRGRASPRSRSRGSSPATCPRTPPPRRWRARWRPSRPALGLSRSAPFTGRVNLFAEAAGVLRVDARGGGRR